MKELLIIPMYRLLTTRSLDEIQYDERDVDFFRRDYNLEERTDQFKALQWAVSNPEFDFKSISPIFDDVKFSNLEIYGYLKQAHDFIEENRLNLS